MTHLVSLGQGIWLTETALERPAIEVRGAVLVGMRRSAVWDTLCRPADMQPVIPLVAGHPLAIVYSHSDWDHCWGTAGLPPGDIIAHAAARGRFAGDTRETLARMRAENPSTWEGVTLQPPGITFTGMLSLDLGGLTLELHSLPGHTPDSLVAFIPETGLLLGGDVLEDPFPFLTSPDFLTGWINGLERWAADPRVKAIAPAHGRFSDTSLIRLNLAYLRALERGEDSMPPTADPAYRAVHIENVRIAQRG